MTDYFYREIDPEKRKQMLDAETDERAKELFAIRFSNEKTKEADLGKDRYIWFLMCLDILVRQKPFFIKREAKKVLKDLGELEGSSGADEAFFKEMKNAAIRLFSTNGKNGEGRRLLGVGTVEDGVKVADQCMDAWRLVYGAPQLLKLDELEIVSEAVKQAYDTVDGQAQERLELLRSKLSGERKRR
ncbi:MAG: DUF6553 family protein [Lachnospiraceae bacterium]|nr:DUF6553 family protein [Lachnospiraceae bacterium]